MYNIYIYILYSQSPHTPLGCCAGGNTMSLCEARSRFGTGQNTGERCPQQMANACSTISYVFGEEQGQDLHPLFGIHLDWRQALISY